MPRYLFLLRADADSEAGKFPPKEVFEQMHAYNASITSRGHMLGGEGLTETAKGVRLTYPSTPDSSDGTAPKDKIEVTPGPFPCTGEHRIVCGYWLIKAKDLDEAVELAKDAPLQGGEVEIRRVHELEDMKDVPEGMKELAKSCGEQT